MKQDCPPNEIISPPIQPVRQFRFCLLAVMVGVIAGLGAVGFRELIAVFHNLLFLGKFSFTYHVNTHTPESPWGMLVIFVPAIGAAGVALLARQFAPEAKGTGVPEAMDAICYNRGQIRPTVALVKAPASALSIGSGGSLGREGPIIQIGASFAAAMGEILRVPVWQRVALITMGAGGGIAATFNTPVGGMLFVAEMMMREISVRTLVPVAISAATATWVGQIFFGNNASLAIPAMATLPLRTAHPLALLACAALGVVVGLLATLFIKCIYWTEDFFEQRVRGSYYRQHILGMFVVGIIIYGMMRATGHYYVQGLGYATVQQVLAGGATPLFLLGILFALKFLVTSLTLGSGGSGGIFSPCLFLGATLGGIAGTLLGHFFPQTGLNGPTLAIAGMAGLVAGVTGAALASIVMLFEMTRDYSIVLPTIISVAVSYGVRKAFLRDSIYTMKLARRGHPVPDAFRTARTRMESPSDEKRL